MARLRWGLIGAGDIVRKRVAAALRETDGSELVAVTRRNAAATEAAAEEFGARIAIPDWRELIKSPEIDAVYIATPVYLHAEQTIAAAEAGKHILCEKPMAMNAAECGRMILACEKHNVVLSVAYYRHFYPLISRIKEFIGSREIGRPTLAQINVFEHFNPSPDDPRHWFVERSKNGGGPMMDFGCHRIEVLVDLFGKARETRSLVVNAVYHREVEDTAVASFLFESGVTATITVTHTAAEPQDTLHIFGTDGSIHVPVLNAGELTILTSAGSRTESCPPAANFHQPLIADFVGAVVNEREPSVTGEAGRYVSKLLDEIYSGSKKTMGVR